MLIIIRAYKTKLTSTANKLLVLSQILLLSIGHMIKKLLILIVFAALYLHFYPQPKLNNWLETQKNTIFTDVSKATDTKVRLRSEKIFTDLKGDLKTFSEKEVEQLKKITGTRDSVNVFYNQYCKEKHSHPLIHHTNVDKICHTISNYQALL